MNELQVFNYNDNEVRTVTVGGEPWLVLKDVCDVLGIENHRNIAARLDEDEKGVHTVDTLGGKQEMVIINEAGLYSVILLSRKPEAKAFKRWVTHEVLPSIRKHGAYMTPDTLAVALQDPRNMAQLLLTLADEQERSRALQAQVEADAPKVLFANSVSVSDDCCLIRELAKILKGNGIDIGQNRLFEWLRENGYLIKNKGDDYNTPTQRAMDRGLFKIKETVVNCADGNVFVKPTTMVTGKGQQYFVNKFLAVQVKAS